MAQSPLLRLVQNSSLNMFFQEWAIPQVNIPLGPGLLFVVVVWGMMELTQWTDMFEHPTVREEWAMG